MIPYVSTCEVISVTAAELTLKRRRFGRQYLDTVTLQPKDRA
jgi:hypothetical protein